MAEAQTSIVGLPSSLNAFHAEKDFPGRRFVESVEISRWPTIRPLSGQ